MKLSEKLSAGICKYRFKRYFLRFEELHPVAVVRRSLSMLDKEALPQIRNYVISRQHTSGGFTDRAGNPDLYYTLFGYYLAVALGLNELLPSSGSFTENRCRESVPSGISLQCAAIIASELSDERKLKKKLREEIRLSLETGQVKQKGYTAFINLLAGWHTGDYLIVRSVMKILEGIKKREDLPSTVISALIVLEKTFGRHADHLITELMSCYNGKGGFTASKGAPVADLLSTAVSLYALRYSGHDLKTIRPECLAFVDCHYDDGGFFGNVMDPVTDIEYTFYGLLALGSLAY